MKNCPENPIIDHENIELLIIDADIKLYFCIYLTLKIVVKEKSEGWNISETYLKTKVCTSAAF